MSAPSPLGIHLLLGPEAATIGAAMLRNLDGTGSPSPRASSNAGNAMRASSVTGRQDPTMGTCGHLGCSSSA